jgi:DNA-binding transcriptional MocR family regulator
MDWRAIPVDPALQLPLYRQLSEQITAFIGRGEISVGDRLPPTRELAGLVGLNRATVSAAYSLLEEQGLIQGHVGRGSFVAARFPAAAPSRTETDRREEIGHAPLDWDEILPRSEIKASTPLFPIEISFASSRPARAAFPLATFRRLAREVIEGPQAADILQLGSPHGYGPLRRYLLEEARRSGLAKPGDDLLVTNGCQQALDLLARVLTGPSSSVIVEDPIYHGLWQVFSRAGAEVALAAVSSQGVDSGALELQVERHKPRVVVLTPSFQNPTGATLSLEGRQDVVRIARLHQIVLLEIDIYSDLRYVGTPLPRLKELDQSGNVVLLGSYSKVSFPGLRVGWVLGPRPLIARLADYKQMCDLHSDQLSQAVLLRFAESGELAKHISRTRAQGARRLEAALEACQEYMPEGTRFTRPEGGMSLWVELAATLRAQDLLNQSQEHGVDFLPGKYFSPQHGHAHALRLSFGGLSPEQIQRGIRVIGMVGRQQMSEATQTFEPLAALV